MQKGLSFLSSLEYLNVDQGCNLNLGYRRCVGMWQRGHLSLTSLIPLTSSLTSLSIGCMSAGLAMEHVHIFSALTSLTSLSFSCQPLVGNPDWGGLDSPEMRHQDRANLLRGLQSLPVGLKELTLNGPIITNHPMIIFRDEHLKALGRLSKLEKYRMMGNICMEVDTASLVSKSAEDNGLDGFCLVLPYLPQLRSVQCSVCFGTTGLHVLQMAALLAHAPMASPEDLTYLDVTRNNSQGGASSVLRALSFVAQRFRDSRTGTSGFKVLELINQGTRQKAFPIVCTLLDAWPDAWPNFDWSRLWKGLPPVLMSQVRFTLKVNIGSHS